MVKSTSAIAFASCRETYAVSLVAAIYSGSKSAEGFASFFRIIPASTKAFRCSASSNLVKPIEAAVSSGVPLVMVMADTVPAGSVASFPYPSLGSPSSAVSTILPSGVNVTISG